jgi:tetratricopeptide (TPR) repeat protein
MQRLTDIHQFGRKLISEGKADKAVELFELNREKFPDDNFTTLVGLARGYEATGKKRQAIKNYRLAAENAPSGQKEYYLGLASELEGK